MVIAAGSSARSPPPSSRSLQALYVRDPEAPNLWRGDIPACVGESRQQSCNCVVTGPQLSCSDAGQQRINRVRGALTGCKTSHVKLSLEED